MLQPSDATETGTSDSRISRLIVDRFEVDVPVESNVVCFAMYALLQSTVSANHSTNSSRHRIDGRIAVKFV